MLKIEYYFVGERDDWARWCVFGCTSFEGAYSLCEWMSQQMLDPAECHLEFNDWYVVTPDGVPVVKDESGAVVVDPTWLGQPVNMALYV